ncbi:FecR family protein [Zobellia galactanivorans]|uniref:Anti-sigma factor n=1 Tax=Zobellia galactanivorans (strain DSM 12802 / CCUG 47099 / CIP 106680 / NCIMB 13871 / Dsij) TaxID=63186 RepID=G0L2L7_ZOBGA|nr:FecR domain-containing protein [Zobellia galactanivorans]CAZ95063.1 anti-sigma factor [Zobellia galactanivorans]
MKNLIAKYLTRQASISELDELSHWIEDSDNREEFIKYVRINHSVNLNLLKFDANAAQNSLLSYIEHEKDILKRQRLLRFVSSAAVIIFFLVGYMFKDKVFNSSMDSISIEEVESIADQRSIDGGNGKAILTLEDGSTIDLEKGKTVETKYTRSDGEELVYDSTSKRGSQEEYNYLTIPRGGQFHLKLADGTLVWLNSESKLKYPVSFIEGKPREVELVYGEAYFEVSPSSNHEGATFKVKSISQEIEVLGTVFNIKAYRDETSIYSTLVEGKVAVSTFTEKKVLAPSEQSVLNLENKSISVHHVDVQREISWKRGLFNFKGKTLGEITKVLSRWYDVDFEFSKSEIASLKFNGVLRKEESLEEILNSILITSKIEAYEINDEKIIIK